MAQFNEQVAREIIDKFTLDKKTIRVWKTRNKIPDKYFDADFVKKETLNKADKIISDRVLDVLFMRELNTDTFASLINERLNDVKQGRSAFSAHSLARAKKEINKLKIDVVSLIKTNNVDNLNKLIKDSRIKYYPILRENLSDNNIKKILFQIEKHPALENNLFDNLKDAYVKFALQLNL